MLMFLLIDSVDGETRQKKSDDQDHQNDNMWADPTIAIGDANKSKMDD